MSHTLRDQKKLLTRIRRIKGQAQAIENALSDDADCATVLQQVASVRGAINGLMLEVLEGHIREHLGADAAPSNERQRDIDQVMSVLKSYLK